jgi:hypothetical protein
VATPTPSGMTVTPVAPATAAAPASSLLHIIAPLQGTAPTA